MAFFDWYQATVPVPESALLEVLTDGPGRHVVPVKAAQGYANGYSIRDSQGEVAKVWSGGVHQHPHAICSGEDAQPGAELIRSAFPVHYVSRCDAAEDFPGADTFQRFKRCQQSIARSHRVRFDQRGDHEVRNEGRTVYLGSPASAVRNRVYDKADELRAKFAKDAVRLAEIPDHLTRFEAQVRPQTKDAKARFATIEPVEVMGSSRWLMELFQLIAGQGVQPVQVRKPWRQADDERAYMYLLAQYGGVMRRLAVEHGSWECFGLQLGHDLDEQDVAKRRARR